MENKEIKAFCGACKTERRIINQKRVEKFVTGLCEACGNIVVKKVGSNNKK